MEYKKIQSEIFVEKSASNIANVLASARKKSNHEQLINSKRNSYAENNNDNRYSKFETPSNTFIENGHVEPFQIKIEEQDVIIQKYSHLNDVELGRVMRAELVKYLGSRDLKSHLQQQPVTFMDHNLSLDTLQDPLLNMTNLTVNTDN